MLQALAGAESLEILVLLKDLSERGLKNLERNVAHAEGTVNATKFGGFSKATKGLKADAEAAAGKRGGGGLGALAGGFLGLPGPIAVAAVAVGGLAALMGATIPVYERVEKQEKALATAAKDHKIALDDLDAHVRASIAVGEQYAFSASDTREAIIKLTSAGLSLAEQQAALPHIMDLARAKHLELAEAARLYELALMGNTRRPQGPRDRPAEADHEGRRPQDRGPGRQARHREAPDRRGRAEEAPGRPRGHHHEADRARRRPGRHHHQGVAFDEGPQGNVARARQGPPPGPRGGRQAARGAEAREHNHRHRGRQGQAPGAPQQGPDRGDRRSEGLGHDARGRPGQARRQVGAVRDQDRPGAAVDAAGAGRRPVVVG
jgi:hypothetical protein